MKNFLIPNSLKFTLLSLFIFSLTACSPSHEEKKNIAEAACAEILATRQFESARRIKVLNEARQKTGLKPYSMSSSFLDTSLQLSDGRQWCEDQIAPPTQEELNQRKIAEEQRVERKRKAEEKAAAEKNNALMEFSEAVRNYTKGVKPELNDLKWGKVYNGDVLLAELSLQDELEGNVIIKLKDNLGYFSGSTDDEPVTLEFSNARPADHQIGLLYFRNENVRPPKNLVGKSISNLIESISFIITGTSNPNDQRINVNSYSPLTSSDKLRILKTVNIEPAKEKAAADLRAANLAKQRYDQALASWDRAVREELSHYEFYRQNPDRQGGCGERSIYSPHPNGLWLFVDRRVKNGDWGYLNFNVSANENALINQYDFSFSLSGELMIEFKDKSIPSIKRQLDPRSWKLGGYDWKDCIFTIPENEDIPEDNFSPEVQKYIKQKFGAEKKYKSSKRAQISPIPKNEYTVKLLINAIKLGGYSQTPFEIECDFYPELKERCKTDTLTYTLPKPVEIAFK